MFPVLLDWSVFGEGAATGLPTPPTAAFTASPLSGNGPLEVTFTNTSSEATSYLWNFGDGNTSTSANPIHTYNAYGVFTVTLTATGADGVDTLTRTNYITSINPSPPSVTIGNKLRKLLMIIFRR